MDMTVQCLCGDIELALTGEPMAHMYCHCDFCQAAHGAAYIPIAMYNSAQVTVTRGKTFTWMIERTDRHSCPRCGTRVFQQPRDYPIRGVSAGLLPDGVFKPMWHQQCQTAVAPIADKLPHYKGYPAALGGTDDLVAW